MIFDASRPKEKKTVEANPDEVEAAPALASTPTVSELEGKFRSPLEVLAPLPFVENYF